MTAPSTQPAWRREGLLVSIKPGHPWWVSHAQLPTVLPLSERLWRIYFAARDSGNHGRVLAVDVDPGDGMRIVAEHLEPVLELASVGAFDHAGVAPAAAIVLDGQVRLYYSGVSLRRDVHAQVSIGLAVSDDGLKFHRAFAGPVHGMGPFDPYFTSAPTVLRTEDGYRMWYVGGTQWGDVDGFPDLFYEIRTTRSDDGKIWDPRSATAVALRPPLEAGLGRPWITDGRSGRRLWMSRRGESYRGPGDGAYHLVSIAADAQSSFGGPAEPVQFENPPVAGDFDSWMQAYACVVPHDEDLVMFYNGNDFGRAGFGWARLPGGCAAKGVPG
jgi:hypothetical protein